MDVRAALTKRIGPLPAWSWGAILLAAILAWAWWRRSQQSQYVPAPAADVAAEAADAGDLDVEGVPDDGTSGTGQRDIDLSSNPAWLRYVVDALTARGEDPALVVNALNKVLAGLSVTQQEAAVYSMAVRYYGYPPEGNPPLIVIPPTSTTPPPTTPPPTQIPKPPPTTPKPKPPPGQWVTVLAYTKTNPPWQSTIYGMAQHFYGNGELWRRIWDHPNNAALRTKRGQPPLIRAGDRVWVPK